VIQTGEKIFFSYEGGMVTAHVQILYSGDARAFAWVVPTPSQPTVTVGSDQLFTVLDTATQPTFGVTWQNFCAPNPSLSCGCASPAALSDRVTEDAGSGVKVISEGPVGPFETAVLSSTNPGDLSKWLTDHGFDVGPDAMKLLAPYVEKHDYFVALKLQAERGTGDLQPIVLKFASTEGPCVPIRLTSLAAQPDLGIAVFLLGEGRAVSTNYLNLVINESHLNWAGNTPLSYTAAVTAAADEAGGHGFATDFSGPTATALAQVKASLKGYDRGAVGTTNALDFVKAVRTAGFIGASQNVLSILQRCVPIPQDLGVAPVSFYQGIETYSSSVAQATVTQPACGDDIDTLVAAPLRDAEDALTRLPTLTRLYTTLSADEMTEDPIFAFNKDLPEVKAARQVKGTFQCSNGQIVRTDFVGTDGRTFSTPFQQVDKVTPALLRAEKMSASGPPETKIDNSAEIDAANKRSMTGCGCMAGGGGAVVLGFVALFAAARRRRWA
jgi:hypothetical protein